MASAVGHISGGHFNPAVTLGFVVTRRMAGRLAVIYWGAQIAGATAGAALLQGIYPTDRIEVIVVDDGGGSAEQAVEAVAGQLETVVLRCPGVGPAAARNRGGAEGRGCEEGVGYWQEATRVQASVQGAPAFRASFTK